MKRDTRTLEAEKLAEFLLSSTNNDQISTVLEDFTRDRLHDLATVILSTGHTLIHLLAQREKLRALSAVLLRGVGCKARNGDGVTPLHCALLQNRLAAARIMIDQGGASVSEVVSRRKARTLLHLMVTCDRPKALSLLLEYHVDANVRDHEGRTPLHLAAIYNNCAVTAILLRYEQCDVNAFDKSGLSALMQAVVNGNVLVARQLAEFPRVDVVLRDRVQDMSALHMAVMRGQLDTVRTLLRRNSANLHCKERYMGRQPIHLACALAINASGNVISNCFLENPGVLAERSHAVCWSKGIGGEEEEEEEEEEDEGLPTTELERLLKNRALTASELLDFLRVQEEERLGIGECKRNRSRVNSAPLTLVSHHEQHASPSEHHNYHDSKSISSSSSSENYTTSSSSSSGSYYTSSCTSLGRNNDHNVHDTKCMVACDPARPPSTTRLSLSKQSTTEVMNGNGPRPASGRKTLAMLGHGSETAKSSKKSTVAYPRGSGLTSAQSSPRVPRVKKEVTLASSTASPRCKRPVINNACPNPRFRARHSISGDMPSRPRSASKSHVLQQHRPSTELKIFSSFVSMAAFHRPSTAPASQGGTDPLPIPSSRRHSREATSSSKGRGSYPASASRGSTPRSSKQGDLAASREQSLAPLTQTTLGSVRLRMVELLLEYGADANLMTSFRKAPIHIAAMSGAADVVALLLPLVPNINVRSPYNRTALHLAVEKGHGAVVEALLRAGANTAARDVTGMTPLHAAARLGLAPIVSLLLQAGASHKVTDDREMTPLHHACLHGHKDVEVVLLSAGASTSLADVAGNMPQDYVTGRRSRVKFTDQEQEVPQVSTDSTF